MSLVLEDMEGYHNMILNWVHKFQNTGSVCD
jgi:hypothetical protein